MVERVLKVGDEILWVGDTVVVRRGGESQECPIMKIGTKLVHLDIDGLVTPFNQGTREMHGRSWGYVPHFCTHAETRVREGRVALEKELRELGLEAAREFREYPNEAVREVIAVLRKYRGADQG